MANQEEQKLSLPGMVGYTFGGLLFCYLAFFGLVLLDEMVFRTFYLSRYVPLGNDTQEFLRWIYWPLLKLLGLP